ncbi:MAG: type II secretion system F family protein [Patescibacteria group bacterium]|nr:type II secretion system F family protein [Patescibacteria group bacterium]MDD4611115.1 type II secretion system F family protein [Patescibacteria group bacterium]
MKKNVAEKKDKKNFFQRDFDLSISPITLVQKALFAKHLSVMLRAGLPLNEALAIIAETNRGRFRKILRKILSSVQAGNTLSSSFARFPKIFPAIFVSTTQAGESSGTLEENLDNLAVQLEKEKELSSKIKGAMLYPLFVLMAAFVMGMAMAFWVLPKITPLFEGLKVNLPFSTRMLIAFSHIVQSQGYYLLFGIIIVVSLFVWLCRQKFSRPVTHLFLLKFPIIKRISRNANLARFNRILGTLLKSGLNIDEALSITADTMGNYYYMKSLKKVSMRIGKGNKLSENLKEYGKFFPPMVVSMVRVGEESGKLEETLLYLADFYEMEVDNATKSLATAIEPLLLMFIGAVVLFLALSIITPIYSITSGINR